MKKMERLDQVEFTADSECRFQVGEKEINFTEVGERIIAERKHKEAQEDRR